MTQPILHHYAGSPFAEKILRILGYKGAEWHSVRIPPILPRPQLASLVGPYRRTPVLQIGADLFLDTRCIANELERLYPEPSLWPRGRRVASDMMSFWVEPRMFVAMAPLRFRAVEDVEGVFGGTLDAASFLADRTPFMAGALDTARTAELFPAALDQVRIFLRVLDGALADGRDFLDGEAPSLADFSAGHLVWWLDHPPRLDFVLQDFPRVVAWFARFQQLPSGKPERISAERALEAARERSPRPLPQPAAPEDDVAGRRIGGRVAIAADDYGRDRVEGELLAADADEVVIRRESPEAGTLHLHFPRIGFEILPVQGA